MEGPTKSRGIQSESELSSKDSKKIQNTITFLSLHTFHLILKQQQQQQHKRKL